MCDNSNESHLRALSCGGVFFVLCKVVLNFQSVLESLCV